MVKPDLDGDSAGFPARRSFYQVCGKRLFDLGTALLLLPLLVLPMLAIALWVRLDSAGPVFYRGVRAGLDGVSFRITKFRTMVLEAEIVGGGTTALNDPRITRSGRWLRKYKLDELPQILDVLMGNMSFVGPRPELELYTSRYAGEEELILSVKPGITDFASIRYASLDHEVGEANADEVFEQKVLRRKNELRVQYVKSYSLPTDLKIMWQTALAIFRKLAG